MVAAVAGCQQELPPSAVKPAQPAPVARPVSGPPVVLHDLLVSADGNVVEHLPGLTQYDIAVPSEPHRFAVRDLTVDAETATVTKSAPPAAIEDHLLVRREPDGRARWTRGLSGSRSIRRPDVAIGPGRVLAAIGDRLHAFDDVTGAPVWNANLPGDRLQVVGVLAYSVTCDFSNHALVGVAVADGKERFRSDLAVACDPTLQIVNNLVIAADQRHRTTRIFDLSGRPLAKFDELVQGPGLALGTTTILVTDVRVVALGPAANVLWQRDLPRNSFTGGDAVAELPGGDFVLAQYGTINDSGVDLVRLRRDGSEVWHSCAAPLGVGHSEYEHFAYLEVRGDELLVASEGSYGAFLEQLAVRTGTREKRCAYEAEQGVANGCAPISKPCR